MFNQVFGGIGPAAILDAVGKSIAIIEFSTDGTILNANANFCETMGYELAEIRGQHHRIFAGPAFADSKAYKDFWEGLAAGKPDAGEYKRFGKNGREVWLQASYNPVLKRNGRTERVVKLAADVTARKLAAIEYAGKLDAISRAQAVIEFTPDGHILTANQNFLSCVGYSLDEIQGQHHSKFVFADHARSPEYRDFWARLNRGEFISAEFRRVGKGGREIWLQAFYSPIFDPDGRLLKVVKFATDITDRVQALNDLGGALERLADGDLCQKVGAAIVPSMETLNANFDSAVMRLRDVLSEVAESARIIRSESAEMGSAAEDLSRRTEQQAASLEETAAAIEEISVAITGAAERAEQAGGMIAKATEGTERSGAVVAQAIGAMDNIRKSSNEIGNIIGVIDEIAFQTNLLALNAGVEAARAGEAGRGFAVVASEVRALAQRSAEAAKEIKALISASGNQVQEGVTRVGESGATLSVIARDVTDASGQMAAIVASAREQAVTLNEINSAVSEIDRMTQQNAAMVEETTAVSQALAARAVQLIDLLGRFNFASDAKAVQPARNPASSHALRLVERVEKAYSRR